MSLHLLSVHVCEFFSSYSAFLLHSKTCMKKVSSQYQVVYMKIVDDVIIWCSGEKSYW